MANIILPAVPVLNEIDDSTKLLIEQAGEINRYPISDLDIGGGDVTIDLNSPGGDSTNTGNPINADTLGGKPASDYVLKDELILDGVGGGGEGDITIEIDPSAKEKPQSPLYSTSNDTHFYPLTTADQVILDDGNRLDDEISKYLTVELEGEAAEPNSINADTLGGYAAEEYVRKDQYPNIQINYCIVSGITEPENPTENMIWVNTDVEISNHIFSKNEPVNPVEGMVWIAIGNSSDVAFHSMKIGDVYVDEKYPLKAHQYVSGAWMDVVAMSHQNGEWVDWWDGILLDGSNQCVDITGGWEHVQNRSDYPAQTTMMITDSGLKIIADSDKARCGVTKPKNKINVTDITTITFYATVSNSFMQLTAFADETITNKSAFSAQADLSSGVATLDVSEMSGEIFVGVYAANNSANKKYSEIILTEVRTA